VEPALTLPTPGENPGYEAWKPHQVISAILACKIGMVYARIFLFFSPIFHPLERMGEFRVNFKDSLRCATNWMDDGRDGNEAVRWGVTSRGTFQKATINQEIRK
jgi:hypothetical protein